MLSLGGSDPVCQHATQTQYLATHRPSSRDHLLPKQEHGSEGDPWNPREERCLVPSAWPRAASPCLRLSGTYLCPSGR